MGPFGRFARGFKYGLSGLGWLRRERSLSRYWLPPVVLTAIAFVLLQAAAVRWSDELLGLLWQPPSGKGCAGVAWWSWACLGHLLSRASYWAFGLVAWLVAAAAGLLITFLLSILLAAPFNDALSEAVERRRGQGEVPPFRLSAIARDAWRTLLLELLKLSLLFSVLVPLFLLSWLVPGVGQLAYAVASGLLTVAYLALDFVDWPAARRGWTIRRRFLWMRTHLAAMLGFGSAVWLLLYLPVINLFLMPAAVIGGTLLFLDLEPDGAPSGPTGQRP